MKNNICLIGFMGSGKTTVGSALAKKIGYKWQDLDAEIVKGEQMSIPELFEKGGEAYFREIETGYLKSALKANQTVISTGGGIVVQPENIALLNTQKTYYLSWDFDTLYERISGDTNRPLATSYEAILERFKSRKALYEAASTQVIACEGKTVDEVVAIILQNNQFIKK